MHNRTADLMSEPAPPELPTPESLKNDRYQALLLATFFILLFLILTVHLLVEYRS
jgi:hypothetical protein